MKVVIAARDPVGTGGGTVAIKTAEGLLELGAEVVFVSDRNIRIFQRISAQINTFCGELLWGFKARSKFLHVCKKMLQFITFGLSGRNILSKYERRGFISIDHNLEAFGGDIVVVHNVFLHQAMSDSRGVLRKFPQFLNPVFVFRLVRERIVFNSPRTFAFVAVSRQTASELTKYVNRSKIVRVIESGVDLDLFHPLGEEERIARKLEHGYQSKKILIFVGHEFERKRLDLVIKAMDHLSEDYVLLVFGGRDSDQSVYKNLAKELGVEGRVNILGTSNNIQSYFQMADVFVLPSDYETWGLVALEAMACGVPIVMSDVGCASEVIDQGENGFVVEKAPIPIASAVKSLIDRSDYLSVRASARTTAERYSWSEVSKNYRDLISEVRQLKGSNGP